MHTTKPTRLFIKKIIKNSLFGRNTIYDDNSFSMNSFDFNLIERIFVYGNISSFTITNIQELIDSNKKM